MDSLGELVGAPGREGQPGPAAGTVEDLIQSLSRQRQAAARAFGHQEYLVRAQIGGTLGL
jgi:hypothetical protein